MGVRILLSEPITIILTPSEPSTAEKRGAIMAETLSLKGMEETLRSAMTIGEQDLQGHLVDLVGRLGQLDYSPKRQDDVRKLQGRVAFELASREVEAEWSGYVNYDDEKDVARFVEAVKAKLAAETATE